jgi:hypothetical protein
VCPVTAVILELFHLVVAYGANVAAVARLK